MGGRARWQRNGSIGVAAVGVLTFAFHVYHLETHSFSAVAVLSGVAFPMAVSLSLVACAARLVNWIVTESGGEVRFDERDPRGSIVAVVLPCAAPLQV